jgi:hypothetical protein
MTTETTCAVIIPEGYASVEAYLAAHEKGKAELHHKRGNDFCVHPLGGNKPRSAPNKWLRNKSPKPVGRPRKAPVPQIPISVHIVAATFERLGREKGIPEQHMSTWIEAACRVAVRAMGKAEAVSC